MPFFGVLPREYFGGPSYDWHVLSVNEYTNVEVLETKGNYASSLTVICTEHKICGSQSQYATETITDVRLIGLSNHMQAYVTSVRNRLQ